ncbi:MAG: class I SAM-dependent methyltransferase [Ornithinimicrobium sp.]
MTYIEERHDSGEAATNPHGSTDVDTFDHGVTSRFNAWFFGTFDWYFNHILRLHKRSAFSDVTAARVVELGAGTGNNFAYLQPGTKIHAVEPNRRMYPRLRQAAERAGVELNLQAGMAERIDLPDGSADEVICTLVLCTVEDPEAVLCEVRRVLRPGGRFRFVEHVAADGPIRSVVQRRLRRPWGWLFEGCDPHRDTTRALTQAGFTTVTIERLMWQQSIFWPVNTAIWGIATE